MKKYVFAILILPVLLLPSCKLLTQNPSLSEAIVAKSIDRTSLKPVETSEKFTQSDPAIHFTFMVTDLPEGTKLKAVWKHLQDGTEVVSEKTSKGTHYEVFSLRRSGNKFPAGKYEVTVSGNAKGNSMEAKGTFEIMPEVEPTHLSNPVTSKAIEDNDKLNPVNTTSQFTQQDKIIYFVVQSKDLPKDSKIRCVWYYADSGDSMSHELVADGSRNLVFSLKPDDNKVLPAGKYIVTAVLTINDNTESVTREFEIK